MNISDQRVIHDTGETGEHTCRGYGNPPQHTKKGRRECVAYYRTSSKTNVGKNKDSLPRQRRAVTAYAKAHGLKIVREFFDAGISGKMAVLDRPAFSEMIAYIMGNGSRTVLVEDPERFARDTVVSIDGIQFLREENISLLPVSSPEHYRSDDPDSVFIQELQAANAKRERRKTVLRLKVARDRESKKLGCRCEGAKPSLDPEMVATAKRLRRKNRRTGKRLSFAKIGVRLMEINADWSKDKKKRRPYAPGSVQHMVRS